MSKEYKPRYILRPSEFRIGEEIAQVGPSTIEYFNVLYDAVRLGYPVYHNDKELPVDNKALARIVIQDLLDSYYLYGYEEAEDAELADEWLPLIKLEENSEGRTLRELLNLSPEEAVDLIVFDTGSEEFEPKDYTVDGSIMDKKLSITTSEAEDLGMTPIKNKDMVKHPDHYNQGMFETIEKFFLSTAGNDDMIKGALLYNIIKYTDRAGVKTTDTKEDLDKAEFFYDLFELFYEEDLHLLKLYRVFKEGNKEQ